MIRHNVLPASGGGSYDGAPAWRGTETEFGTGFRIRHLQTCAKGNTTVETDGLAPPFAPERLPKTDGSLEGVVRLDEGVMVAKQVGW